MGEIGILLGTAIFIGTIHTLIGVDHYIPFVAMSQSNNWTMKKTMWVVLICGIGHVLSSVLLGIIGIFIGTGINNLVHIESVRGDLAVWFLIAFGIVYTAWGIKRAIAGKSHTHTLPDGSHVEHTHTDKPHAHKTTTFWTLFILFVLGPCEPLIPILMYPALEMNIAALILVTAAFSMCTIATMLTATFVVLKGINLLPVKKMERYTHALAGASITLCGICILAFGI